MHTIKVKYDSKFGRKPGRLIDIIDDGKATLLEDFPPSYLEKGDRIGAWDLPDEDYVIELYDEKGDIEGTYRPDDMFGWKKIKK